MDTPILRQIIEDASETITVAVPLALRHRRVEIIVLPLDTIQFQPYQEIQRDANGWPSGFFEATFGSLPNLAERAPQGEYELRESIE